VSNAIALASGRSAVKVEALLREICDSGVATNKAMATSTPSAGQAHHLSLMDVYQKFQATAGPSGGGGHEDRVHGPRVLFDGSMALESHAISQVFHRPVSLVDRGYSLTSDMGMVTLKSPGGLYPT
jgi:hypothetical protein